MHTVERMEEEEEVGLFVRQFLRGRSVLLTGATGFLGKALLHKLLS